ncbi:HNH endonuclease [Microbulbifer sp. ALW1]|uniref:HNH endonuclease n=1 Tax=Microbulbifer sp. (strain ALW1) TaxID=1516059 RepID=UPI001358AC9D|nr:HNH endonuclease [Microbulbifer sp. ALW1]
MRKLEVPSSNVPYSQRHKDVVNAKNNTIKGEVNETKVNLLSLEGQILSRYDLFEQAVRQNLLFDFQEDHSLALHKDDLLSCYKGRTAKLKEIFTLIEGTQPKRLLKRCPYCGVTLPKTYDHYLPESKFPELSVHVLNLVPCCADCNQTKSSNWKNAVNRVYLHFYSDQIPESQYLMVSLQTRTGINAVGAIFSIQRPAGILDGVWSVLSAHYERLNLVDTYNELASDEISEVFNVCVSHLKNGGDNISGFIQQCLSSEEQLYGLNHWRVVLMKALSESPDFSEAVSSAV